MSHATLKTEDIRDLARKQLDCINLIRDAHAKTEHEAWERRPNFFWITKDKFRRSIFSLTAYGDEYRTLAGIEALALYAQKAGTETMLATTDDMKLLTRRFS
jgi:hypothetical protein